MSIQFHISCSVVFVLSRSIHVPSIWLWQFTPKILYLGNWKHYYLFCDNSRPNYILFLDPPKTCISKVKHFYSVHEEEKLCYKTHNTIGSVMQIQTLIYEKWSFSEMKYRGSSFFLKQWSSSTGNINQNVGVSIVSCNCNCLMKAQNKTLLIICTDFVLQNKGCL